MRKTAIGRLGTCQSLVQVVQLCNFGLFFQICTVATPLILSMRLSLTRCEKRERLKITYSYYHDKAMISQADLRNFVVHLGFFIS